MLCSLHRDCPGAAVGVVAAIGTLVAGTERLGAFGVAEEEGLKVAEPKGFMAVEVEVSDGAVAKGIVLGQRGCGKAKSSWDGIPGITSTLSFDSTN